MTKSELKSYLETELLEGKCDSYEDRLLKLSVLEAVDGTIDCNSENGKKMIYLLDSVNDVLQKIGIVGDTNTFYNV